MTAGIQPTGNTLHPDLRLFAGYSIRCLEPTSHNVLCIICQAVLRNPYQTPFGQRACKSCLVGKALQQLTQRPGVPLDIPALQQTFMVLSPAHGPFSLRQCYQDRAFQRFDAEEVMVQQCPVRDCRWSGGTLAQLYNHEAESHPELERTIPSDDVIPKTYESDQQCDLTQKGATATQRTSRKLASQLQQLQNSLQMDLTENNLRCLMEVLKVRYQEIQNLSVSELNELEFSKFLTKNHESIQQIFFELLSPPPDSPTSDAEPCKSPVNSLIAPTSSAQAEAESVGPPPNLFDDKTSGSPSPSDLRVAPQSMPGSFLLFNTWQLTDQELYGLPPEQSPTSDCDHPFQPEQKQQSPDDCD
ncbi:hypothetical protein [Endozoicomonas sp. ONNA2]|uniref:hypothetical protein n=1 Tax=Endozoicomonas sp. ONNA2 TaxID=2828741 RepID=UPI0021474123|nr:hypothetical protein [Endozoicomonas sp. ONNA2]